jgi:hypothetical protein
MMDSVKGCHDPGEIPCFRLTKVFLPELMESKMAGKDPP